MGCFFLVFRICLITEWIEKKNVLGLKGDSVTLGYESQWLWRWQGQRRCQLELWHNPLQGLQDQWALTGPPAHTNTNSRGKHGQMVSWYMKHMTWHFSCQCATTAWVIAVHWKVHFTTRGKTALTATAPREKRAMRAAWLLSWSSIALVAARYAVGGPNPQIFRQINQLITPNWFFPNGWKLYSVTYCIGILGCRAQSAGCKL